VTAAGPWVVRVLDGDDLEGISLVSSQAFDPIYGEAWSAGQYLSTFALPGFHVRGVSAPDTGRLVGFSISRVILDESELLLLAVVPDWRGRGVGKSLINDWLAVGRDRAAHRFFLEVRRDNPAQQLYVKSGFAACAVRPNYYRGADGKVRDAITMERTII
jgi:ribosomal-protein-alanine N-acetyltransferase